MQFTYESQGTNTFLVYEMLESEKIDSVTMGMIENNKIEGVIPFNYSQLDTKRYLKYNVSSKVNLSQFFSGIVNKQRLIGIMESVAKAVLNAQDYMIETESFVWDTEYIYVDVTNTSALFVCLPVIENERKEISIEKFLKNMLLSVQFDQTENVDYVAKLLGFFNANTHFSLHDFLQMIRTMHDENIPSEIQLTGGVVERREDKSAELNKGLTEYNSANVMSTQNQTEFTSINLNHNLPMNNYGGGNVPTNNPKQENKGREIKKGISIFGKKDSKELKKNSNVGNSNIPNLSMNGNDVLEISTGMPDYRLQNVDNNVKGIGNKTPDYPTQKASFGGTVVLNESNKPDGTTVLNNQNTPAAQKAVPYLVRMKNQQKIPLSKAVFTIGSDMEKSDYPVADNRAVSKCHAELHIKGEQIFIVDNASTNHTFVAGNMIPSNKEVLLQDKAKFVLANEEFELHIS